MTAPPPYDKIGIVERGTKGPHPIKHLEKRINPRRRRYPPARAEKTRCRGAGQYRDGENTTATNSPQSGAKKERKKRP
nr:MAG TPA: hypothetical protein [Caudoviricetes sp.]